jgi:hypothetical protein
VLLPLPSLLPAILQHCWRIWLPRQQQQAQVQLHWESQAAPPTWHRLCWDCLQDQQQRWRERESWQHVLLLLAHYLLSWQQLLLILLHWGLHLQLQQQRQQQQLGLGLVH